MERDQSCFVTTLLGHRADETGVGIRHAGVRLARLIFLAAAAMATFGCSSTSADPGLASTACARHAGPGDRARTTPAGFGGLVGSAARLEQLGLASNFTGGPAIQAGDPHGPLNNPPCCNAVVIDSVSRGSGILHVGGASFAGQPLFPLGFNSDVAWGCTVSFADVTDA
jgi:acyl-homoserine lactone acylase PvdQ